MLIIHNFKRLDCKSQMVTNLSLYHLLSYSQTLEVYVRALPSIILRKMTTLATLYTFVGFELYDDTKSVCSRV